METGERYIRARSPQWLMFPAGGIAFLLGDLMRESSVRDRQRVIRADAGESMLERGPMRRDQTRSDDSCEQGQDSEHTDVHRGQTGLSLGKHGHLNAWVVRTAPRVRRQNAAGQSTIRNSWTECIVQAIQSTSRSVMG